MNDVFDDPEEDFEDFAAPTRVDTLAVPAARKFEPWHRPRKQFVRKEQWSRFNKTLITDIRGTNSFENGGPLKYLTLPGPDLLDIKMLSDLCSDQGLSMQYIGFCHASGTDEDRLRRNTDQFRLERSDQVADNSYISTEKLEEIVRPNSKAKTLLKQNGPYDIINIDACSPLARQDQNQTGRLIDAIRTIVSYQLDSTRKPWLLYLTTPVERQGFAKQALEALHSEITANVQNDPSFKSEIEKQYEAGEGIADYLNRTSKNDGRDFVCSTTLGISKWFLHLAEQANFGAKSLQSYCYSMLRREPYHPNMISTCYLFTPNSFEIRDETGLTQNVQKDQNTQPISNHYHALNQALKIQDLDRLMLEKPELCLEMANETKALLQDVGYNTEDPLEGYDVWLKKQPVPVNAEEMEKSA